MKKLINIDDETLKVLKILAKKEGRTLANYIEQVLIKTAKKFKAPPEESNS